MLVVHQITPQLVRLDPEHQDLYLDNEIALMMQLHGLEAEIASRLGPAPSLSADRLAGIDPYFRHRFLDSAMIVAAADEGLRKVSDAGPARVPVPIPGRQGLHLGLPITSRRCGSKPWRWRPASWGPTAQRQRVSPQSHGPAALDPHGLSQPCRRQEKDRLTDLHMAPRIRGCFTAT